MNNHAAHLRKRYRAEKRFRCYGMAALAFAGMMLLILIGNVALHGASAFQSTEILLDVTITTPLKHNGYDALGTLNLADPIHAALRNIIPDATSRAQRLALYQLISRSASIDLYEAMRERKLKKGDVLTLWLPASSTVDMFIKHGKAGSTLTQLQQTWLATLQHNDRIRQGFNTRFFSNADSRMPEKAGILGSLIGSLLTVVVCLMIAVPFGIAAAIYLEELAPKNRLTDIIEVNINNLAAVPSIIFGLLGLSVFLQFAHLPRSSALVGGCTLALLVLPTMIIATRQALKAVPPTIRDAARGLGANEIQILCHHTLPLALPAIMTGVILSIARALGETAPLLMIGMVAFIADVPHSFADPATTLPVQIFIWSDSPEMGFVEKTSGTILVLLAVLAILNFTAAWIRRRYEIKW